MNCDQAQPLLSAYLDGETAESEQVALAAHLAACPDCRSQADVMRRIADAAAALPRCEPSAETILAIRERIHRECPVPRRTGFGPVLDLDDLADYLRVHKDSLGPYLDDMPNFELGGKLLFRTKSVEEWIRRRETSQAWQLTEPASGTAPASTTTGDTIWKPSQSN